MSLSVNGEIRQNFLTSDLIHKIPDQIAFLSKYMNLHEGDMILTGTGDGISIVKPGDIIETYLYSNE